MADILFDFYVNRPAADVYQTLTTPEGMDQWWTLASSGSAKLGALWRLDFGSDTVWQAKVVEAEPAEEFELEMVEAMDDWLGTKVGFSLVSQNQGTLVCFRHSGWETPDAHFRTSSYCWAMYLRILKRYLEHGETVAYHERDKA